MDGFLETNIFNTEPEFDFLDLLEEKDDNSSYSGGNNWTDGYNRLQRWSGSAGPTFVEVKYDNILYFESDGSITSKGFSITMIAATPLPTPSPTLAGYCADYVVTMYDSFGDGWSGVTLHIGGHQLTLEDGSQGTETVCLYLGRTFEPYTCDGSYPSEVSWTLQDQTGDLIASDSGASAARSAGKSRET